MVPSKALWFYEEPSPDETFIHLRHLYRFFEELFKEMVL